MKIYPIFKYFPLFCFFFIVLSSCSKTKTQSPVIPVPPPVGTSLKIEGISPTSGGFTDKITITGKNFSIVTTDNVVKFNGKNAYVESATATQLIVTVPRAAGIGPITITSNNSTATNENFSYTQSYVISTFAGSVSGYLDANGANAKFKHLGGIAIDAEDNLYVTDDCLVRKISPSGQVTTIAGIPTPGYLNGDANMAQFADLNAIAIDGEKNIFVTEYYKHRIRKISSTGIVSTLAGNGTPGGANGIGEDATFNYPTLLTVDKQNNVYVGWEGSSSIRKITVNGTVSTLDFTGQMAQFPLFNGIAMDATGNFYLSDTQNDVIYKLFSNGNRIFFAGDQYNIGTIDGIGTTAKFYNISSMTMDKTGNLYILQKHNNSVIRKITAGQAVTTIYPQNYKLVDADSYDAQGKFIKNINNLLSAKIVIDSKGTFYYSNYVTQKIHVGRLE